MALPEFLTRSRSLYRIAFVAGGLGFVGFGLALGASEQFMNWGVVTFLVVVGTALVTGGVVLDERRLQFLFTLALIGNAAMALYAFLASIRGSK